MKKKTILISSLIVSLLSLLSVPVAFSAICFSVESKFDETYYGELKYMVKKLKDTKEKKIILVGNSNVAFGCDSALIEKELCNASFDYKVCNFGLYGAIGSKAMLSLAKNYINKDDILIFTPELYSQSMSTYFSGKDMWYSLDSDFSMFYSLQEDEKKAVLGNTFHYVQDKFSYCFKEKPKGTTSYKKENFDKNCDMKNLKRKENIMPLYYDSNNPIVFDTSLLREDFLSYLNDYASYVNKKGAKMFYSFAPMNQSALTSKKDDIDNFYNELQKKIDFRIISSPYSYILDRSLFYDSNFHLNDTGVIYRSLNLVSDIENEFSISKPLLTEYPPLPPLPKREEEEEENPDNSFENDFEYEEFSNAYRIISLKEEAKKKKEIVIPYSHNGKEIIQFSKDTFLNNTSIEKITLQSNIKILNDHSFRGCTSLKGIYLKQKDPEKLSIGFSLFEKDSDASLYVLEDVYDLYIKNYFFGFYRERIKTYEE